MAEQCFRPPCSDAPIPHSAALPFHVQRNHSLPLHLSSSSEAALPPRHHNRSGWGRTDKNALRRLTVSTAKKLVHFVANLA